TEFCTLSLHDALPIYFRNPFGLLSVLGFAVFLGVIIVLGRAVGEAFGATGAVAGAIVAGLVDVDAITISMVHLTPDTLSREHARSEEHTSELQSLRHL